MLTRRNFHQLLASAGAGLATSAHGVPQKHLTRHLGICDWTIKHPHQLTAFDTAKSLGLEGVQVSFGEPDTEIDLRKPDHREQLFTKAAETDLQIASLGMGILNKRPYASDPKSEQWVADSIDVIAAMRKEFPKVAPSIVLLAFFGKADLKNDAEGTAEVIRRLKKITPAAEEAGVVFGIESLLDRAEHEHILHSVDSPAVQVYYDTANSARCGYDIYDEVKQLGSERICQIHIKENNARIGEGDIDFARFKNILDSINYDGWLILEGSRVKGNTMEDDNTANSEALRSIFAS